MMAEIASDYDSDVIHAINYGVTTAATWLASSDQTANLQAAIDAAKAAWRDLLLPPGIIRVDGALDCTGMFAGGLRIKGAAFGSPNAGTGTVILANTGGTVFDFTGSQWCSIEDVVIDGIVFSPPTPSRIGILYARGTTSLYCQFNTLKNVQIKLPTNMTENGATGSYGIVNLTGEIHNYHNLIVHADNCVACLATKPAWLSSTFKTIDNTITSMSVVSFSGFTSFTGLSTTRPAFIGESLKACSFEMLYTVGDGTTALDLEGCEQVVVKAGSFEGHSFVAAILRNGCKNIDINYYSGGTPTAPLALGSAFSSVSGVTFRASYNAGWTRIIERGDVGNVLTGVSLHLAGDTGSVSTSNLTNITGVYRPIRLSGSTTTDVASIANNAQASFDVTVTGVALDGTWVCRVATSADPGALGISAIVRAANTVRVTLVNNSGGAIDPASLTYTVLAERLS